jgi:2-keto-4-pentenoate hydratase/2-oxohepta-3-ene-1,7-dioic acid hydratase in catechol pathway
MTRIARFSHGDKVSFGVVDADGASVTAISGEPFSALRTTGEPLPLSEVRLLAPVTPSKVVGFGMNYEPNAPQRGDAEPAFFLKPPTSVVGPGDTIVLPARAGTALHEAELAIVIGRKCRHVAPADVAGVVLGYTCANDVTATELPAAAGGQWAQSKGFDTFCPLGPWIETELDPSDLAVGCTVNGEQRQDGRSSELLTKVPELVALASEVMTLLPGDVILTSSPGGVGPMSPGDEVTITIEGIGSLVNPVASA